MAKLQSKEVSEKEINMAATVEGQEEREDIKSEVTQENTVEQPNDNMNSK